MRNALKKDKPPVFNNGKGHKKTVDNGSFI